MPNETHVTITDVPDGLAELPYWSIARMFAETTGCKASTACTLETITRILVSLTLMGTLTFLFDNWFLGIFCGALFNIIFSVVYAHIQEHANRYNYRIVEDKGHLFNVKQVRLRESGMGVEWQYVTVNLSSIEEATQSIINGLEKERQDRLNRMIPSETTVRRVFVGPQQDSSDESPAE